MLFVSKDTGETLVANIPTPGNDLKDVLVELTLFGQNKQTSCDCCHSWSCFDSEGVVAGVGFLQILYNKSSEPIFLLV